MLTKEDLRAIKSVVKEEFAGTLAEQVAPFQNESKRNNNSMKADIAQIRKDMKVMLSFVDSEYVDLRKRVERIEDVLKIG